MPDSGDSGIEQADKLHRSYAVLSQEEMRAWLTSKDGLPRASISAVFRAAEKEFLDPGELEQEGGGICGDDDGIEVSNDDL